MPHIITRNASSVEQNWLKELTNAISDPFLLLKTLNIDPEPWKAGLEARKLFALRVPMSFVARMEIGNPHDPLLRQILPLAQEYDVHEATHSILSKSKIMKRQDCCTSTKTAY